MDINQEYEIDFVDEDDLDINPIEGDLNNDADLDIQDPTDNPEPQPLGNDELSDDEKLINMWVDKEYLMINPEEDQIESIDDAFKLDAQRRTDFIKEKLIESFPEDFRILAEGVINHGVTDVKKILEMMSAGNSNTERELDDAYAAEIVKKHYQDVGWDEEDIEMDIRDRKEKNKLIGVAQRILDKQNEVENRQRKIEIEQEVARQKIEEEANRKKQEEHQALLINQFKQKAWREDTKKQIAEEYFKGATVQKAQHLLTSPDTAADFAMIVSRIFKTDPQGRISLDMNSLVDLVKTKEIKNIKNDLNQKAFSNKIRFTNVQRQPQADDIDTSEYEFNY